MSKINIHTILKTLEKTYEYNVPAIFREEDGIIIYKEQDDQNTTTSFNYRTKELIRENDSLKMHYKFNKEKNARGTIFVKELGRTFDLIIKTNIFIVYLIILPNFAKWSILPIRLLRLNIGKKHQ